MEVYKMSVACTSINNEYLSRSLLGNKKETNVFNRSLNKPDGTSFHIPGRNPRSVGGCAGKQNQRNGWTVPARFPCQQPQNQDEEYAAKMHPGKNELSDSEVIQSEGLLRHPVVEHLMVITSQRITSDGTTRQ